MTEASVGFHCPECLKKGGTRVLRAGQLLRRPFVTQGLIAVNVVVYVLNVGNGELLREGALFGPAVADGEWWRLVTSGFLHAGLLHLAFNMLVLYRLGMMLEPELGPVRYGLLYLTALLGGSLGAVLLDPNSLTVGASGAVFGLMGAAVVGLRSRGVDVWQTDIGSLLAINLLLTFLLPRLSIGGHLGGLVAGALAGWVLLQRFRWSFAPVVTCTLAAGGLAAAGLVVAST